MITRSQGCFASHTGCIIAFESDTRNGGAINASLVVVAVDEIPEDLGDFWYHDAFTRSCRDLNCLPIGG